MSKVCMMCGTTYPDSTTFCAKDGAPLRASVKADSLIGELFCDRYVVTDLLGEGGMGSVYAASDVRLPQQVAIKVLREHVMSDPTIVARFRQEAEAASRINHDRVARVTDFGFMTDGRAYLVMEYVGGRTLKQVISEEGPLSVAQTSTIVTMVAEGLDAAHRLGIVHRDLKPDNVMVLDDAGGGVRVKVLDFGIAKSLHGNEDAGGKTKTGFVIGTPQWMSPEQILGESLDARSDVYALGLLTYTMLTGQRAFEAPTTEAEMMARLTSPPRTLRDAMPTIVSPAELELLLKRTLARNVNDRPEGTLAFARALANIAARFGSTVVTSSGKHAATPVNAASAGPNAARGIVDPVKGEAKRPASPGSPMSAITEQHRTTLNKVVAASLGLAAVAAIAFFAVSWWPGDDNKPAAADGAGAPLVSTPAVGTPAAGTTPVATSTGVNSVNDTANRVTAAAPVTEPPSQFFPSADSSGAKTNVAARQNTPPSTPRTVPPTAGAGRASAALRDSAKDVVGRGAAPEVPAAPPAASKAATAASIELKHLMDLADVDFADKDLYEINARIRRFESLLPELGTPTDKGYAHMYIGMSHNALGDNVKACASLGRAEPFATQSRGLRMSIDQWQQLLKCGPG